MFQKAVLCTSPGVNVLVQRQFMLYGCCHAKEKSYKGTKHPTPYARISYWCNYFHHQKLL